MKYFLFQNRHYLMKKFLAIILLITLVLSLSGCVISDPTILGWDNKIDKAPDPSSSCEKDSAGTTLSNISYFLINPIVNQVQMVSILVFDNFVGNTTYAKAIKVILTLYIIIYGIMFIYQLVPITLSDLMVRIVKIGVVLALITQGAYDFFNKYLFKLFTDGAYQLLSIVTNPYCDTNSDQINFFYFFSYVIDTIFSKEIFYRLVAMIFTYPIGWICAYILLVAMIKYLFAVIKAIIAYLIAFTAIGLLIALAPLFIILILFDNTRELFDNWMKALVIFALQPVILFAGIFFVTMFVNYIIQAVFVQCVWKKILPMYINFGDGMIFTLFSYYFYVLVVDSFINFFASLIIFYLCVDLLGQLPKYVEAIALKLVSGTGMGVLDTSSKMAGGVSEKMKGIVGMDKESKYRRNKERSESSP